MESRNRISLYLPIVLALVLILGIWLGSKLSSSSSEKINKVLFMKPESRDKINDLINYLERDYVDSLSREDLTRHAIEGVMDKLDPHSQYIPAEDLMDVEDQLNSNFEGIGIQFRIEKDTIMVIQTIPGGPSEKVGLLAGDRIVKINDSLVAGTGITNRDAVHLLKGNRGTEVKVSVFRRGLSDLIDFGIDEHAADDSGVGETINRLFELGFLREDVEAAFGRHLVPAFRHQHGHFRLEATGNLDHFVGRRHFQIELDQRQRTQFFDVCILNVASILAQMNSNPVRSAKMCLDGSPRRLGFIGTTCLTNRGHVVNIYAQFDHSSCSSIKILRVSRLFPPV